MEKTDNQFRSRLAQYFEEVEKESDAFKTEFRRWPFIIWLLLGVFVGAFSILLPPAPDSHHFIDPSTKMIVCSALFLALTLKITAKLAKKYP